MTVNSRTILLIVVGVLLLVILVVALLPHDQSLKRLQQAGVIRIGYAVEAPYIFLKPGGELTGAEIEVAKEIVARLGIPRIEWRLVEFDQLIPQLEAGQIDAAVAGMFITPERAKRASFSEPTFHVQQGLLVAAGNPHHLHSYADVAAQPEIEIAVLSGAVEGPLLKQLGVSDEQLVQTPDALTGRVALETGRVDGLALSALTIRWMALQDQLGRTEMAEPFEQPEQVEKQHLGYGAVVFRPEDRQLRLAWNAALKEFLGSPEYSKLTTPFGYTRAELPGSVTTEQILSLP